MGKYLGTCEIQADNAQVINFQNGDALPPKPSSSFSLRWLQEFFWWNVHKSVTCVVTQILYSYITRCWILKIFIKYWSRKMRRENLIWQWSNILPTWARNITYIFGPKIIMLGQVPQEDEMPLLKDAHWRGIIPLLPIKNLSWPRIHYHVIMVAQ